MYKQYNSTPPRREFWFWNDATLTESAIESELGANFPLISGMEWRATIRTNPANSSDKTLSVAVYYTPTDQSYGEVVVPFGWAFYVLYPGVGIGKPIGMGLITPEYYAGNLFP